VSSSDPYSASPDQPKAASPVGHLTIKVTSAAGMHAAEPYPIEGAGCIGVVRG
jgi:hypothetical protein